MEPTESPDDVDQLQKRVTRLTDLLAKAKATIEKYKKQVEDRDKEVAAQHFSKQQLEASLDKLRRFEPPRPQEITEVLARLRLGTTVVVIVAAKQSLFALRENEYQLKGKLPEVLDARDVPSAIETRLQLLRKQHEEAIQELREKAKAEVDKARADAQAKLRHAQELTENEKAKAQVSLQQADTRLRKTQEALEAAEARHKASLAANKNLQLEADAAKQRLVELNAVGPALEEAAGMQHAISNCLTAGEPSKFTQVHGAVLSFLNGEAQGVGLETRQHIGKTLLWAVDIAKKLAQTKQELVSQETEWRSTCSELENANQSLKLSLNRLKAELAAAHEEHQEHLDAATAARVQEVTELQSVLPNSNSTQSSATSAA